MSYILVPLPIKGFCYYRNTNGCQSCYPDSATEDELGKTIVEPQRSLDGKFHKVQAIKCKFPECI